jgi:hypothetical protein
MINFEPSPPELLRTLRDAAKLPAEDRARLGHRALIVLGRLQRGPATTLELMQCGGGLRPQARIHELRHVGHRIEKANMGGGCWQYTLVLG